MTAPGAPGCPQIDDRTKVDPGPALRFFVTGLPLAKGSPSILRNRRSGRPFVREKPTVVSWQQTIRVVAHTAARAQGFAPLDGPVAVELLFQLPRRRSAPASAGSLELAAVKPDLDKLVRAACDALEGVAYTTDSRVTRIEARKVTGPNPGVRIYVRADTASPIWSAEEVSS